MKNKIGWTDGPWEVINGFDVFGPLGGDSGDGVKCDDSHGWHVASCDPRPSFVQGVQVDLGYDAAKANAHLVSAARELYHALELYMKAGHGNSTHFADQASAYSTACSAMAKARGE